MPLKIKPTVLDRLKELEGDAKARRISEALPILASGITPMEPCIHITESVASSVPGALSCNLNKTMDQITHAVDNGIATITLISSSDSLMIKRYELTKNYSPLRPDLVLGYNLRLYIDNLTGYDAGKTYVEYTTSTFGPNADTHSVTREVATSS